MVEARHYSSPRIGHDCGELYPPSLVSKAPKRCWSFSLGGSRRKPCCSSRRTDMRAIFPYGQNISPQDRALASWRDSALSDCEVIVPRSRVTNGLSFTSFSGYRYRLRSSGMKTLCSNPSTHFSGLSCVFHLMIDPLRDDSYLMSTMVAC